MVEVTEIQKQSSGRRVGIQTTAKILTFFCGDQLTDVLYPSLSTDVLHTRKFENALFYGLDDTFSVLCSNAKLQAFYDLDDTSAVLCSNAKLQTFYGLDDTSAELCSNTKLQTFYGLGDKSAVLCSNTKLRTFYGLGYTSVVLCSNTKLQTFYGLGYTSAVLCSNTKLQTFSCDCGRRYVGRCLEAAIMRLNLLVFFFCDVEKGASLCSFWLGGIAGFVFMVEVVGTERCTSISGFKMNCIRK